MRITLKLLLSLIGIAFLFFASPVFAAADPTAVWNLEPQGLLDAQAPADVARLINTLDNTRQAARAMERQLRANGINQLAMIRFGEGYDEIWLLYRLKEKVFVVEFTFARGRVFSRSMGEAVSSEWSSLFNTLLVSQQKKPTPPLAAGRFMRVGEFWQQGYLGVVNIYNEGETRTYLLATEDIKTLSAQSSVDALLCSTIFAGLHCQNGDHVIDGWVQQQLHTLMKHSQSISQSLISPDSLRSME